MNTLTLNVAGAKVSTATDSVAYRWGANDAKAGLSCVPEMYFVKALDRRRYALGFESIKGFSALSRQILGDASAAAELAGYIDAANAAFSEKEEAPEVDYDGELEDLREGIADEEFWRSGRW